MSIHISAKKGDIAERVLLPGDPLRAKFIADTFLEDAEEYSHVRGMYGFTGTYKGERVSVQGTGMGIPSISIYVTELIEEYGAKKLIRIGSCGSINPRINLRDIIMALSASTDASFNKLRFGGRDYAATADFTLLENAVSAAKISGEPFHVGTILTSDTFYQDDPDDWKLWAEYGVLAEEMETAALYTIAARFKVQALALLTVSDDIITGASTTSEEREKTFTGMMNIALDAIL